MITADKKIRIFDDTGSGDDFVSTDILYEDSDIIVCNVFNEWYEGTFKVVIYKEDSDVSSNAAYFYLYYKKKKDTSNKLYVGDYFCSSIKELRKYKLNKIKDESR